MHTVFPTAGWLLTEGGHTHTQPIDMVIFNQILELEEGESYEFAWEMSEAYFAQAETTFGEMEVAM